MTNFVLVHGAFQEGMDLETCCSSSAFRCHMVYTPTLDGCGERAAQLRPGITTETQAAEVAKLLWSEDLEEVILVGASAGGMFIAKTAELARARIAKLVFLDTLALMDGECIRDITAGQMSVESDLGLGPTREDRFRRFRAEFGPNLANWAADRSTLHPIGCFIHPVVLKHFWMRNGMLQ